MTLFLEPIEITAHYRIATPMFLGGENHQVDAVQFRNPSFKGALRFWWRALNWGKALAQAQQHEGQALKWLHDEEGRLFGMASDGQNSRQSPVQIHSELQGATLKNPAPAVLDGVGYLLGQGLYHFRDGVLRSYLEGGDVKATLRFKPGTATDDVASVRQAAIALGLFGGLGSRSRRGLGSLAVQKVQAKGQAAQEFTSVPSIQQFIDSLDFSAPANAPLSALTVASRIDISATGSKALAALQDISNEMQLYRSFGREGKVNGQQARQKFRADHDNVLRATQGTPLTQLPQRAVFGLPHNYFFSSTKGKLDINPEKEGRRASPLLVHIHPLQDGNHIAIQTLMPGRFLPQGMHVDTKVGGRAGLPIQNTGVDFSVIANYLDGFPKKQTLKAPHRG